MHLSSWLLSVSLLFLKMFSMCVTVLSIDYTRS